MSSVSRKDAMIVGISHGGYRARGRPALEFEAQAALAAIDDAGLEVRDIDGIATVGGAGKFGASTLAEYLGIQPTWVDTTHVGGCSYQLFVAKAASALADNQAENILVSYGSDQRSGARRSLSSAESGDIPLTRYETPHGPLLPITAYALVAERYLEVYDAEPEDLAEVAVAARDWARENAEATFFGGSKLSVEDVQASQMVSSPLHRRDCCLVTDGAGALVMTTAEIAPRLRQQPVRLLGDGFISTHRSISQAGDVLVTGGEQTAQRALSRAGLAIGDIDVIELYDSFTITVLLGLEAVGVCAEGEAAEFVRGGTLGPGGRRPVNTDGGGLASGHAGVNGIFLIIEAVRQLRGTSGMRQLAKHDTAICHAVGGYFSTFGTIVLARE